MSQKPPSQISTRHNNNNILLPKKPSSSSSTFPEFLLTAFSLYHLLISPQNPNPNPNPHKRLVSYSQRRFFKTMSPNPTFSSPNSLSDWLKTRLPSDSFAAWGVKPGTKNVHSLWLELSEGETSLADSSPPVRTLDVVIVRIKDSSSGSTKTLIESHQELSDGSVRKRSRPLSEKMKPGETVESAVHRAVQEELGSVVTEIVPGSYVKKVEERVSVSYPGLPAVYVLHSVEAMVSGLPEGEFWTEEGGECQGDGVADLAVSCRKHYWKWVDSDSV